MVVELQLVDSEGRARRVERAASAEEQHPQSPDPPDADEGVAAQAPVHERREDLVTGPRRRQSVDGMRDGLSRRLEMVHRL
jgi:hypothetical protein